MNARPAECLKCPHPASSHDHTGCKPPVGMCACDVPRTALPVASAAWESSAPAPEPVADPVVELVPGPPPPEPAPYDPEADRPPRKLDPTPPRTTVAGRQYDWTAIKRRYVEGVKGPKDDTIDWPSLSGVATHFGLDASRVRERSALEGWVEQRRQFQTRMETTRQAARIAALTKKSIDLDNRAADSASLGLQLAMDVLTTRAREIQESRKGAGEGSKRGGKTIDALELSRLAAAVDLFHKIGLRAVGDPQVTRLEVTGAGGSPIEISTELKRDDPDRLSGVLAVLHQAGLGDLFGATGDGRPLASERRPDGSYEARPPGR